jgi:iron complex outermembrane receptor protein
VSSQAGSATTGIYLDDVPINVLNIYTTGATEPRFFDIDRVEVLRGPQGTLYGASSMGGTLHFVSNQPDLHNFSGGAFHP